MCAMAKCPPGSSRSSHTERRRRAPSLQEVLLEIATTKGVFYGEHGVASGPASLRCGPWQGSSPEPRPKEREDDECAASETTANQLLK